MNIREIKELIKTLNESDIAELEYEAEGVKLALRKKAALAPVAIEATQMPVTLAAPASVAAVPEANRTATQPVVEKESGITIVAPMVGTFYRAPSPDAAPYVEVGDEVSVGQPLCIIEAMKLMNEIESEVKGRVVRIMAENAQPVEYGQPLFVIEPF